MRITEKEVIIDRINSKVIYVSIRRLSILLLKRLPNPIEKSMSDRIIVHWNTESPKKYDAMVARMYSATIPESPVAKIETLRSLE